MYGNLSTTLAAEEVVWAATAKSSDVYLGSLSLQIVFCGSEYSFLQLQLVDLIKAVLSFPEFPTDARLRFTLEALGDAMQLSYGRLFEEGRETEELIDDCVNLDCFVVRLLSVLGIDMAGEGDVAGVHGALFTLSTGSEDHPESHKSLNIDIPAATQYVIHAGNVLFKACMKGFVPISLPSLYLSFRIAKIHIAFCVA